MTADHESTDRPAPVTAYPPPSEPTDDALAAFKQAVDEGAFFTLLRRMVAEMETEAEDVTAA